MAGSRAEPEITTRLHWYFTATMLAPPPYDPMSMFVNGKLRPGVYQVQHLVGQTFLEILQDSKEVCCRPAAILSPQDALVRDSKVYR